MPRILLVDDDIELTELLAELLSLEGFEIHCVHNGQDALTELELQSYDLILLDVMMPVLNGIETLKQLRQKHSTPVLMLSARDDEIDRELVARIKAILRRTTSNILSNPDVITYSNQSPEENSKQLSFGGVELHPGRQQAIFEGRDLDLTGTEFALLQMLMRNPGQILSRELLSLEILGKRLTPYDRAIDMHISNLRKKLPERNDNLPWFKTLRGRGYLLVTEK